MHFAIDSFSVMTYVTENYKLARYPRGKVIWPSKHSSLFARNKAVLRDGWRPSLCFFHFIFSLYFWTGIGREASWSPSRSPGGQTLYSMACTDRKLSLGTKKRQQEKEGEGNKTETQALKWKFCRTYSPGLETISLLFFGGFFSHIFLLWSSISPFHQ